MKITKWKTISSIVAFKAFIFRYRQVERESPTTGQIGKFDIVECLNWVNIIAITADHKFVLVKQYRHGIDAVTLELPGGAVNPGEDFLLAAQRELQEETGFTSSNWKLLGRLDANPAFMNNYCETYLALDALATHPQELDPFEEIDVYLRDKNDIKEMVKNREITHSLIVAAFFLMD